MHIRLRPIPEYVMHLIILNIHVWEIFPEAEYVAVKGDACMLYTWIQHHTSQGSITVAVHVSHQEKVR